MFFGFVNTVHLIAPTLYCVWGSDCLICAAKSRLIEKGGLKDFPECAKLASGSSKEHWGHRRMLRLSVYSILELDSIPLKPNFPGEERPLSNLDDHRAEFGAA